MSAQSSIMVYARLVTGVLVALAVAACASNPQQDTRKRDAANYNMQLGVAYMNQGNLLLAKEKLDKALQENPDDPNVHSARALLEDRLGDQKKADEEFRTASRLAPKDPDIQNNYAVYLCRTGRTEEGVKGFLAAARNGLYRTPASAYTNAGVCLHSAHRDDEAAQNFKKALEIRPNYAEAAYQLGNLDLQHGRLVQARAETDQYLGAYEATPDLLLLAVRIARAQGDQLSAVRYARRLALDFPGSDQARALAELDRNPG
jgi:type IV pilus assembly protein PilF